MHNFKLKKLQFKQFIDDIANFQFFKNFVSMKYIKKKICYTMVDLSKFTSSKKILSKVVVLGYDQFYSQTLFKY